MAVRGPNNILTHNNPQRGQVRNHIEVVQSGIDRHNTSSLSSKQAIKNILGIEGEAVGTLNTQELHSKTLNGGFF